MELCFFIYRVLPKSVIGDRVLVISSGVGNLGVQVRVLEELVAQRGNLIFVPYGHRLFHCDLVVGGVTGPGNPMQLPALSLCGAP